MKKNRYSNGELEIEVLNSIRKKKRASVHEVCALMKHKRKYTTILTVMQRLFVKGEVNREKVGRHYEYWVNKENRVNNSLLNRLRIKIFGNRTVDMVSYLLDMEKELTQKELDELQALIEKHRARGN